MATEAWNGSFGVPSVWGHSWDFGVIPTGVAETIRDKVQLLFSQIDITNYGFTQSELMKDSFTHNDIISFTQE